MEDAHYRVVGSREEAAIGFLRLLELLRAHRLRSAIFHVDRRRLILLLFLTGDDVGQSREEGLLLLLLEWHIGRDTLGGLTLLIKSNIKIQSVELQAGQEGHVPRC